MGEPADIAALQQRIEEAFAGVALEGGVSLHQMDVLDAYGSQEDLMRAAALDQEACWQDVTDDKLLKFGVSFARTRSPGEFPTPWSVSLLIFSMGECRVRRNKPLSPARPENLFASATAPCGSGSSMA